MNLNYEKIKELSEECNDLHGRIEDVEYTLCAYKGQLVEKESQLFDLINPNTESQCMMDELKERLKVYEDKINELEEELKPYRLLKNMDDKKKRGRPRKNESEID